MLGRIHDPGEDTFLQEVKAATIFQDVNLHDNHVGVHLSHGVGETPSPAEYLNEELFAVLPHRLGGLKLGAGTSSSSTRSFMCGSLQCVFRARCEDCSVSATPFEESLFFELVCCGLGWTQPQQFTQGSLGLSGFVPWALLLLVAPCVASPWALPT